MKFNKLVAMCALAGLITTACSQKRKAVIADKKAGKAEDALKKDEDKADDDKKDDAKKIPSLEEREVVLKAIHEAALADLNAKLKAAEVEKDAALDANKDEDAEAAHIKIEALTKQIEELSIKIEIVRPFKSSNDEDSGMFIVRFNDKTIEATTRCKIGEDKAIKEDVVIFNAIYSNDSIALSEGKSKNEEINCMTFMPADLEKINYIIDGDELNLKYDAVKSVDASGKEVEEAISESYDLSFMPITESEGYFFESENGENQATEEVETDEVDAVETDEVDAVETDEVDAVETDEVDAVETDEVDAEETDEVDAEETDEVDAVETDEVDAEEDELDAEVIEVSPETTTVVEDEETEEIVEV